MFAINQNFLFSNQILKNNQIIIIMIKLCINYSRNIKCQIKNCIQFSSNVWCRKMRLTSFWRTLNTLIIAYFSWTSLDCYSILNFVCRVLKKSKNNSSFDRVDWSLNSWIQNVLAKNTIIYVNLVILKRKNLKHNLWNFETEKNPKLLSK